MKYQMMAYTQNLREEGIPKLTINKIYDEDKLPTDFLENILSHLIYKLWNAVITRQLALSRMLQKLY